MKIVFDRLKAPTPKFFKKIQKICVSVAIASTLGLNQKDMLPDPVIIVLPYGVTAGVVGTFIAQMTKEDKESGSTDESQNQ